MKYRKLELLFLAISLTAILVSIMISFFQKAELSVILGQALYVPVLFIALHYGRQYGFLAASGAALIFLISKAQESAGLSFATIDGRYMIGRAVLFGLIGIFGSELAIRAKYLLVKLSAQELIDSRTNLYSQNYLQKQITRLFHTYYRYSRPFSIVFIDVDWPGSVYMGMRDKVLSRMADIIRSNVRLIDEVGYTGENSFCLVLPHANSSDAHTIFERLKRICATGNVSAAVELKSRILSMPENQDEIIAMIPAEDIAGLLPDRHLDPMSLVNTKS